ncbi:hypothetical protein GQ472_01970 [archaeon]|nr:hypothetical protein [archaeon]
MVSIARTVPRPRHHPKTALDIPCYVMLLALMADRPDLCTKLTDMSKVMDVTYSHVQSIRDRLIRLGYVNKHRDGRNVGMTLTVRGKALAVICNRLVTELTIKKYKEKQK